MHMLPLVIEPEHDQPECALVLVDGTVNGRPCRFVLDTGAARSQIVADETFADLAAGATSSSAGVLGTSAMPLAPVAELALGPLRASNLEVWLLTDPHQPGAHHLLGMDLLIRSCCRFLFKQAALCLEPSPSPEATQPLTLAPRGHSYLTLTWPAAARKLADETTQQVTAQACWDTGAAITVVDQTFFQAHPHLFSEPGTAITTDSTGAQASTPTYTMAGPEIGGHRFASHKVAVVDLSPVNPDIDQPTDLILGYPTLSQAEWLFDYPARRWAITGGPNA